MFERVQPSGILIRLQQVKSSLLKHEMSLGYKTSRAPRTTNLPGGVGSAIAQRTVRRMLPRQTLVDEIAAERRASKRRTAVEAEQPRDAAVIEVNDGPMRANKDAIITSVPLLANSSCERSQSDDDKYEHHSVYGTTRTDLTCSETGNVVAKKGERVMFVYPMQTESDKGDAVYMRLKTVHKTTAALKYHWVCIYSGVEQELYYVEDFSTQP